MSVEILSKAFVKLKALVIKNEGAKSHITIPWKGDTIKISFVHNPPAHNAEFKVEVIVQRKAECPDHEGKVAVYTTKATTYFHALSRLDKDEIERMINEIEKVREKCLDEMIAKYLPPQN